MKNIFSAPAILLAFMVWASALCIPAFGQNSGLSGIERTGGGQTIYRPQDIPNVQLQDARRFVSDPDGLLSAEAVHRIDTMLLVLRQSGRAQAAVVAVNSIGNADPFDFLHTLLDSDKGWGVGDRDKDNGLGILLVIDQGVIEMQTGYGLEGDLPDAIQKRIIENYMLPHFRQRDWDGGMIAGVEAVRDVLNGIPPEDIARTGEVERWPMIIALIGIIAFPLVALFTAIFFSNRCPRCKKRALHRTGSRVVVKNGRKVEEVTYTCKNCGYVVVRDHNHGGGSGIGPIIGGGMLGGGFGRGGFGGGSGGSWGGGSFGGGGARGRF